MRSGNGRHRRPRQVPALVVTAGVTGSALALPLLAATSATAADTSTWDKVAECESGGAWSANFGSGAYGGLQFTQEEWQSAAWTRLRRAPRPREPVAADRGGRAGARFDGPAGLAAVRGLGRTGPAEPRRTGGPRSARRQGPARPGAARPDDAVPSTKGGKPSTDYGSPTPSPSDTPFLIPDAPSIGLPVMPAPDVPTTPPVDPTLPGTTPTPVDPTAPTLPVDPTAPTTPPVTPGLPPVSPTDPAAPGAPETPETLGATPGVGNGKHRGAPAPESAGPSDVSSNPTYTVQAGDSLATIAVAKGVKGGWNGLYEANEQVIGEDANLIKPGQNLDLTT